MKAIIIGASSGIGAALAQELAAKGYELGLTARRVAKLEALQAELPTKSYTQAMDVQKPEEAREQLAQLVERMGGMDLIVLNAGISQREGEWETEWRIIQTNIVGITALGNWSYHYFKQQKKGHIVGISSVSAERGVPTYCVYGSTKSYLSHYIHSLRYLSMKKKHGIDLSDIRPGYVYTEINEGAGKLPFAIDAQTAAKQIMRAISAKKRKAYVPGKWRFIGWMMRNLPDALYIKLS